jgi:predicted DNA binding CopG/RHH family protein
MAKKKSFKADDIAEQFLSGTEETAPISTAETVREQRETSKTAPGDDAIQQQGRLFEVPMKPDYRYIETKSKRLNLLVQPSVFEKVKNTANKRGVSVNEFIHSLLEAVEA